MPVVPLVTALAVTRTPVTDVLIVVEGVLRILAVSIVLLDALMTALTLCILERVAETDGERRGELDFTLVLEIERVGRTEFELDNERRDEIDEETDRVS